MQSAIGRNAAAASFARLGTKLPTYWSNAMSTNYNTLLDSNSLSAVAEASPIHALDCFCLAVGASMESNSNSSTINNSNSNSHREATMSTNTSNSNASNSNASNSKRNGRKANSKANSKASAPKANSNAAPTLPETLPAVANAGISAKGMEQDASTSLLFQYHIRQALAAYGGAASICQVYNFLRGDSPLRLEKDGSPKVDGLPRWRGLGSSKLFRANTEGTLLTYTHKVCANGRIRSVAVAGPMLQDFSK